MMSWARDAASSLCLRRATAHGGGAKRRATAAVASATKFPNQPQPPKPAARSGPGRWLSTHRTTTVRRTERPQISPVGTRRRAAPPPTTMAAAPRATSKQSVTTSIKPVVVATTEPRPPSWPRSAAPGKAQTARTKRRLSTRQPPRRRGGGGGHPGALPPYPSSRRPYRPCPPAAPPWCGIPPRGAQRAAQVVQHRLRRVRAEQAPGAGGRPLSRHRLRQRRPREHHPQCHGVVRLARSPR